MSEWRKDSLFSKLYLKVWASTYNSMNLEHSLILYTKTNSEWLKDLNIRYDTIKFLEENIGEAFSDINCSNVFLGKPPKAIEKGKINK